MIELMMLNYKSTGEDDTTELANTAFNFTLNWYKLLNHTFQIIKRTHTSKEV